MEWILMPLRRYAEFSGRSRRKEYWMFILGVVLLYVVLGALMVAFGRSMLLDPTEGAPASPVALMSMGVFGIVLGLVWLALIIPSLAVGVRRLHDIDRTGLWLLLPWGSWLLSVVLSLAGAVILAGIANLVSLFGWLIIFIFALLDGTRGPNRFGEDPKGPDHSEVFA